LLLGWRVHVEVSFGSFPVVADFVKDGGDKSQVPCCAFFTSAIGK